MTPKGRERRRLLQSGTALLLLVAAQIARGANILAVRVWPAQDYTRVTIESDGPLETRQIFVPIRRGSRSTSRA
jgi:N-acetylmuramoyl-L-alanine amidase